MGAPSLGRSWVAPAGYGQSTPALIARPKKVNLARGRGRPLLSRSCSRSFYPKLVRATAVSEKTRPLADFGPDYWGDVFIDYIPQSHEIRKKKEKEHELLKEKVGRDLVKMGEEPIQFLKWVDEIERLGLAYHFQNTIEGKLQKIYEKIKEEIQSYDLYHTSLMFRLFRQHRYYISSDVFKRFVNDQGEFLESFKEDPLSLLSLYEAGYVKGHGEEILEKALKFAKFHLKSMDENHPLAPQIERALRYPNQRGVTRVESRHFISFYEKNPSHNESLLRFAKLDFDLLQSLYKEELKEVTRWQKQLNLARRFPFARIRPVQCYFFGMAMQYEPKFSVTRKNYAKISTAVTILDDIYDAFGTLEELEVFTEFADKWDKKRTDSRLPNYMKDFFEILFDVIMECEDDLTTIGRRNYMDDLIREHINLCKAYLHEARWRELKYIPTYEEYMENGIRTCSGFGVSLALLTDDVEESIARKAFDVVLNNEHPQKSVLNLTRCMNDLASLEFDKDREHVATTVECYMNQHGVFEFEARAAILDIIEHEWKIFDEEIFNPKTDIPVPYMKKMLNFNRVCNYIYKCDNGFSHISQRMDATFSLLFVDPIAI